MADPGTPDWWLDRLYKKLRDRAPRIQRADDWFTGNHPVPLGYEDASGLFARIMDTVGLNMMATVTTAPLQRMRIAGFKSSLDGAADEAWAIWQANRFDRVSKMVRVEKMALSESYVMVAPPAAGETVPRLTGEHPEQCIVEHAPGDPTRRLAALKVWFDDTTAAGPQVHAWLDLGARGIYKYAAPARVYLDGRRSMALRPTWELQPVESGPNPLGEVSIVPFTNRARMLNDPLPEFTPALPAQKRINKTVLDRMAMQDQGAFKAMWATGLSIPRDPATGEPVEKFIKAVDRMFVNENPDGKYGQLQAEDITQVLAAVRDDIADCAILVPTSPDQILGKLVNVSGDGLKLAQVSEVGRTHDRMEEEADSWEEVGRLSLIAAGSSNVPDPGALNLQWFNPEYRTDTEQANAASVAIAAGMPAEAAWARYFNASPAEVADWKRLRADMLQGLDPAAAAALAGSTAGPAAGGTVSGGNANGVAGG